MNDPVAIASTLVCLALIAAWFAHQRWANSAVRRQSLGLCARCGVRPIGGERDGEPTRSVLGRECRNMAQGGYRAASWFFCGLGLCFAVVAPFIVRLDSRRFGWREGLTDAAILLAVVLMNLAAGFAIRYFGAKE